MDRAIVVCCGDEESVTAEKYISEGYCCQPGYAMRAYCPMCHQPVFFARGQFQSPHFRHERNNPVAQWCELYSSNSGCCGAQYERIPSPLLFGSGGVLRVYLSLSSGSNELRTPYLLVLRLSTLR